ncbi:MAG: TonB-dependent receptor [Bacteroidales bacterium]|nr:TonB-dependent receptor [Bacteroidales bacterium]
MKKSHESGGLGVFYPFVFKLLRIMKIMIVLICFIGLTSSFGNSYSQNIKLSVELQNASIEDVLNYIEGRTEYSFMYDNKKIDISRKVNISAENQSIEFILDQIFENEINYQTIGKHIIIFPKERQSDIIAQQQNLISGKVTDLSGAPLPGVSVLVKGTANGAISDKDGKYTLSGVPENATLQFSFIGMVTQEIPILGKSFINVTLVENTVAIEEIVVVGYGTQKKVNLSGSISTINPAKFESRPVISVEQALQGQMPGVSITQTNGGQPGREGINVSLRGLNSFASNSNPLVVIDGIVGSFNDIDINSVENMTVLKDASSAAIYGARAANGVILVTTKTGKNQKKLVVRYSGKMLFQTPYMMQDRVWDSPEYMQLYNIGLDNSKNGAVKYTDAQIDAYKTGPSAEYPWMNYEKAYINNVAAKSHNLSFSGTTGNTSYYIAGTIWSQDGIIDNFGKNRYNVLANLESQVNSRVKFGFSANIKSEKVYEPFIGGANFMYALLSNRPTYTPFLKDDPTKFTYVRYANEWAAYNPEALVTIAGKSDNLKSLRSNAFIDINLLDGLTWSTKGSTSFIYDDNVYMEPSVPIYYWDDPSVNYYMNGNKSNKLTNTMTHWEINSLYSTLNYNKSIGVHSLNVLAGVSGESYFGKNLSASRQDLPSLSLDAINAGSTSNWSNSGTVSEEHSLLSYFGRINYSFNGKYLLEFNSRYDGSSRFPKANKFGFFPSLSAAWRVSEETFVKNRVNWLDNFKLRASVGIMGNDNIGDYPYQSFINLGYTYPFINTVVSGSARTTLGNEIIKWESTKVFDIGLDATFSKGLLDITFDWYDKQTDGILRSSQLAGYVGLNSPTVNQGVVSNKGFDVMIGHRNHIQDVNYGISFLFSRNRNKLMKFGAPELNTNMMKEGKEMWRYYVYQADGLFQSQDEINAAPDQLAAKATLIPGDIRLKDISGPDGVPDGKVTAEDRIDADGYYPKFEYGTNMNVSWKGFNLSAFFQGVYGIKRNINHTDVIPFANGNAPLAYWKNAWSDTNKDTDVPVLRSGWYGSQWNQTMNVVSTFWLKDASYFRLKNITLDYKIPNSITKKYQIESITLLVSVENVFTLTPFKFGDPESGNSLYAYPSLRTISFGIDLKF